MTDVALQPLTFDCGGHSLIGLLHRPARPKSRAVVIVVGGPQYRIGSHRQYVMLARALADAGYAVLRFDYRGIGDSDGPFVGFEGVFEDIRAAVDALCDAVPETRDVVLWGLCDGASAIAFYARHDPRIDGVVLLNPWVRSDAGLAKAQVKHYYLERMLSPRAWGDLLAKRGLVTAVKSFASTVAAATVPAGRRQGQAAGQTDSGTDFTDLPLPQRVGRGLLAFQGRTLLILSGKDLTAGEFESAVLNDTAMRHWRNDARLTLRTVQNANHTYSRREWRDHIHRHVLDWLDGL